MERPSTFTENKTRPESTSQRHSLSTTLSSTTRTLSNMARPGRLSLTNIALVEAVLGPDDEAVSSKRACNELARSQGHSYSLVFALVLGAVLAQFQRDAPSTSKRAKEALELATEYAFPQLAAWAAALVGWVPRQAGAAS